MAKENSTQIGAEQNIEIAFKCHFCGETKPFSELVIQTRYFPMLTSCRSCESLLQSIPTGDKEEEGCDTAEPEPGEDKAEE
jgi:hypothetical protein